MFAELTRLGEAGERFDVVVANDGDADGDGLPDETHVIPHGAAAAASSTAASSESAAVSTFTLLTRSDAETSTGDEPILQVALGDPEVLPIENDTSTELANDDVLTDEEPAIDNEAINDLFANFDELLLDDLLAV